MGVCCYGRGVAPSDAPPLSPPMVQRFQAAGIPTERQQSTHIELMNETLQPSSLQKQKQSAIVRSKIREPTEIEAGIDQVWSSIEVVKNFIGLLQSSDQYGQVSNFICEILQRIGICLEKLQDNENVDQGKIRRIRKIMKTQYESYEEIYGREDPMNLWKHSSNKRDLLLVEQSLNKCTADLIQILNSMNIELAEDQQNLFEPVNDQNDQAFKELLEQIESEQQMREEWLATLQHPEALQFYNDFFDGEYTIDNEKFLNCMLAKVQTEGLAYTLSECQKYVILLKTDLKEDEMIDAEELNTFFEESWPTMRPLLEEGNEDWWISQELGETLCRRTAQLEVSKCNDPTLFKQGHRFILLPEGFQTPNQHRKKDRHTWMGTATDGPDACDIIFHPNDSYCGPRQAVIKHKSDGYYLVNNALNGYTRIFLSSDDVLEMSPGVTLSFGMTNRVAVATAGQEGLEIYGIEGPMTGNIYKFIPSDSPVKVGRPGCRNRLEIASGEVSRAHGQFVYTAHTQSWSYRLDGDRPTNGTWEGVSFYDVEEQQYSDHEGTLLRVGDVILIGQ